MKCREKCGKTWTEKIRAVRISSYYLKKMCASHAELLIYKLPIMYIAGINRLHEHLDLAVAITDFLVFS